jgi:hypothetical protein
LQVEKHISGGSALPVIVADGPICAELLMLEKSGVQGLTDKVVGKRAGPNFDDFLPYADVTDFLHELGWFFQISLTYPRVTDLPVFLPSRQKDLLIFAVKRDWCALVNKLLDLVFGLVLASPDKTSTSLSEFFGDEMSLLHLAVERQCRPMVRLLLAYSPPNSEDGSADLKDLLKDVLKHDLTNSAIFTPNMSGPGGSTPLHMAATMKGAEEIIDDLTSDPNEVSADRFVLFLLGVL